MTKNIYTSAARWNQLHEVLLALAQGDLNMKIPILHHNDELESVEVLLNMLIEEWKQRVLQLPFSKPTDAQKYMNHFQLFLNHKLQIIDTDKEFLLQLGIEIKMLLHKKLTEIISPENLKTFNETLKNYHKKESIYSEAPTLEIFGKSFIYTINHTVCSNIYLVNLYQIQLDAKHDIRGIKADTNELMKLEQKKRYRDIVQEVKKYIDQHPLSELIQLKSICKQFGINIFQLKIGFKELYQTSVYEYFLTLRMKHAYLLIETSSLSLKEISQMVGYSHYPTFSAQFYKFYELRPRVLRKNMEQKQQNGL